LSGSGRATAAEQGLPLVYYEARQLAAEKLTQEKPTIKVLASADARDYFIQKNAAQGKNVAELVKHMTENGLRFAPAVDGDEAAYVALHRAVVAFHAAVCRQGAQDR